MNFVGLKNVRLPIYKNINFKHVTPIYKNKTPWYTTNLYKFIKLAVTEAFPMTSKKIWTPIFHSMTTLLPPKLPAIKSLGNLPAGSSVPLIISKKRNDNNAVSMCTNCRKTSATQVYPYLCELFTYMRNMYFNWGQK